MSLFGFVTEDLLPQKLVIEITAPYWRDLTSIWMRASRMYARIPERIRGRLEETTAARSINLNFLARSFARSRFGKDANNAKKEGASPCVELPSLYLLEIQSKVLIRFNLLSHKHVVRLENASDLKRQYFGQAPIVGLNNSATRLTVGPVLDAAGIEIVGIVMSLQVGPDWVYSFPIDGTDTIRLPVPDSLPPNQPSELWAKQNPK